MKIRHMAMIYVVLFAGFATFAISAFRIVEKYELVERGIHAQGFVARLDCANHASIVYQFNVQGRDYQGFKGLANCPRAKVGGPVDVYYLGENPSANLADPPRNRFRDAIRDTLIIAFLGATVALEGVLRTCEKGIAIRTG